MLTEIIEVQLSGDFKTAENFINKYFVWTDANETIAKELREVSKTLNGVVVSPLEEELLK